MADYDVAIIGFGPVGAVAACILGQAGIRTLVVDRSDAIYDKPRAVALDHEIARVLQAIGVGDALKACAEPFTDSVYFGADGRVIKRLTMLPEPHPQGWLPSMVFMQPALEEAVRAQAAQCPAVEIRLKQTLTAIRQEAGQVVFELDGEAGKQILSADYLIGCDGASSTVRTLSGMSLDDLGFDQPWLVVDVLANESGLAKLPKTSVQYCDPARPTTFVICTGDHRRWELRLQDSEDPATMEQPAEVWRLLERWITPADATLWRSAAYRFHALVARDWRSGRVFIAGDAAHQQPPFLGQGLCQGIRDVANLGWKLTHRLKGQAGDGSESLLDTYGTERGGHVRKLTGIIKNIGGLIGELDPVRARQRDDHLIAEAGGTILPMPRQDLMPAIGAGFISAKEHPARGTLFPQPWVHSGAGRKMLDDVAGGGLRLVLGPSAGPVEAAWRDSIEALGGRIIAIASGGNAASDAFVECDGVVAEWFSRMKASAALVRPDNYVFGVASGSEDVPDLISEAKVRL